VRSSSSAAGGGEAAPTPAEDQAAWLPGRYVDSAGAPIADVQSLSGTEYKRLPVRLVLEMDVRQLNYLVAQFANQSLQMEVQEVRINPMDIGQTSNRGMRQAGNFAQTRGESAGVESLPINPQSARVVIQGVIFFYNEPSADILNAAKGEGGSLVQNN
jgi:hypothetical protein